MEPDRFQQAQVHYILGMIALIMGFVLLESTVYVFPFLVFNWQYNIPDFLMIPLQWGIHRINTYYLTTGTQAGRFIFSFCFFVSILLFVFARYVSNKIDNQIYKVEPTKQSKTSIDPDTLGLFLKLFAIVIGVFTCAEVFEWIISSTSPTIP